MVAESPTRDKILCYLITVCFIRGRFIPSHGEVHSVFISHGGEMGGRRDQRRRGRRMKKSALFATIVFFGACWLKRARRKSKGKGWIGLFS
jgi:hypothetical protein